MIKKVLIIGGGFAGLGAAYSLMSHINPFIKAYFIPVEEIIVAGGRASGLFPAENFEGNEVDDD